MTITAMPMLRPSSICGNCYGTRHTGDGWCADCGQPWTTGAGIPLDPRLRALEALFTKDRRSAA